MHVHIHILCVYLYPVCTLSPDPTTATTTTTTHQPTNQPTNQPDQTPPHSISDEDLNKVISSAPAPPPTAGNSAEAAGDRHEKDKDKDAHHDEVAAFLIAQFAGSNGQPPAPEEVLALVGPTVVVSKGGADVPAAAAGKVRIELHVCLGMYEGMAE
jgi:hypothetical protein